jgi:hypothetical protein
MYSDKVVQIIPLLKRYVEKSSTPAVLHCHQLSSMRLPFNPYAPTERQRSTHYFLLVAALDTAELVGISEHAKAFLIFAYNAIGNTLFESEQKEAVQQITQVFDTYYQLGVEKHRIPEIIDAVNTFIHENAEGNLITYAKKFKTPEDMAKEISSSFRLTGGQCIEHAWMYLRWMVRPYPDLKIFDNFSPKQLQIPLTVFIKKVAYCLGLAEKQEVDWSDLENNDRERKAVTRFAAELFPNDPTIVDYPFFILGRWIRDEKLSLQLLTNHLYFWQRIYDQLKKPPIIFNTLSKNESTFQKNVRKELEKLQLIFLSEPYPFSLPEKKGAPHYTPDFVLPRCRKKGKIVILEPHGIWTQLQKRIVTIGRQKFSIWAPPDKIDNAESAFVNKLRVFRELYKDMYYLILIVPSAEKERVKKSYLDIYDELYDGADIPKLLFDLKKNME